MADEVIPPQADVTSPPPRTEVAPAPETPPAPVPEAPPVSRQLAATATPCTIFRFPWCFGRMEKCTSHPPCGESTTCKWTWPAFDFSASNSSAMKDFNPA